VIHRVPAGRAIVDGAIVAAADVTLSWSDPAAQWALGVFETIAIAEAGPRHLHQHLDRLAASALRLSVPLPAKEELWRAVETVAAGGGGWLKIVVSRSGRWAVFAGPADPDQVGRALSVIILPWRRHRLDPTTGIKSMGYAAAILGLEEAHRRGADEGLWLNDRGHVMGACAANVFVIRGRAAVTPALTDGARDGVTRARAISALKDLGIAVRQSKVRMATLAGADEVFLTSSVTGVRPVVRIDGRNVRKGEPGPITRRVADVLTGTEAALGAPARPRS